MNIKGNATPNNKNPLGVAMTIARALFELLLIPFRLTSVVAATIHGLGHALALLAVGEGWGVLQTNVVLEGVHFRDILSSLLPGQPLLLGGHHHSVIVNKHLLGCRCRLVSIGGIAMNLTTLIVGFLLVGITETTLSPIVQGIFVSFAVSSLLAMASRPDWQGLWHGFVPYWACGPAFAVRYGEVTEAEGGSSISLISSRLQGMVEILSREASTRGGQSGGFSVMVEKNQRPSIVFDKVVKGKREDIVRVLMQKLDSLQKKARKEGYSRPSDFEAVLLHLRYATGGATHWHNAQPHWYEYYESMIHHHVSDFQIQMDAVEVFNMIAHNGDMDGVYLDILLDGESVRQYFTQPEARGFFLSAMPWTSSNGNSDSRSVAEWVDFHLTQGLSMKALRYAWFTKVLDFNTDIVFRHLNADVLLQWADKVDQAMIGVREDLGVDALEPGAVSLADMRAAGKQRLIDSLEPEVSRVLADADVRSRFLTAFLEAFLEHDLTWVMRRASRDLVGEFALMVCTTLEPRMGVFSLTQAFSIGHNLTRGEIFGSAEPLGVTTSLHQGDDSEQAYQIYLEDGQYATIEFRPDSPASAIRIFDRAPSDDSLRQPAQPALRSQFPGGAEARSGWFPVNLNPKIPRTQAYQTGSDEVAKDLREIPFVLKQVVRSFKPGGENHSAMRYLSELLFASLLDANRDPHQHDLVLYGVDFNQDLIGEFAVALGSILPGLRVRAENSGNVLKELKRTHREGIGRYGPKTIFFGVSNSAQTQSTLAVVRKARDLNGPDRCFVLSQSFLNSMTEAIGQGYHPDDKLLPNTFVNLSHMYPEGGSGRRRAEAATVVLVATQAVLTEILVYLTEDAIRSYQVLDRDILEAHADHFALRPDLNLADIRAFREFQSAVYEVDIPNRVGCNTDGRPVDSPDLPVLEREAEARAENQVEFVRSYALFAAYIVIATLFGVPLFAVLLSPLAFVPGMSFVTHVLDAMLFLSALWLIHIGIRKLQGRPLLERIGSRAEVYIDRKYIARIIERYNATLFSNAPAFITPFFYWADTVRDALHRYGIRAHRGVVTIHRTPDERMGIEEANNAAEENMVYSQLGGIRFNGGQPQSRDKVRAGSCYVSPDRPCQLVLSDSLGGLRAKYDCKLSSEMFRLINRRLIDLSDGLVTEFILGYMRKQIVNQSIWSVIRWIPGAGVLYEILLRNDIDLRNLAGEADTANQAQIQSTKHPVSPMDFHGITMKPRSTFDALRSEDHPASEPFAVLGFADQGFVITLNRGAMLSLDHNRQEQIYMLPGTGKAQGFWVSPEHGSERVEERYYGYLDWQDDQEWFVIENPVLDLHMSLQLSSLSNEQRQYLHQHATNVQFPRLEAVA